MGEPMTRQDWRYMAVWWAFLLVAVLVVVSPLVSAATWKDTFSTANTTAYNYSAVVWKWDAGGNLNNTGHDSYRPFSQKTCVYRDFNVTLTFKQFYPGRIIDGNRVSILISQYFPASSGSYIYTSRGNQYAIEIYNTTTLNSVRIMKTIAGVYSAINITTRIPDRWYPNINNTVTVHKNGANISVYLNNSLVNKAGDLSFGAGFVGFIGYQPVEIGTDFTHFYYFSINETVTSQFSCNPLTGDAPMAVTCNQSGSNFGDSGVETLWTIGNGVDSSIITTMSNFTYLINKPGTYTVGLLNSNVAGSSSQITKNYITISGSSPMSVIYSENGSQDYSDNGIVFLFIFLVIFIAVLVLGFSNKKKKS